MPSSGRPTRDLKRKFAWQLLAPIQQNTELLQTLALFFEENFSPAAAAERLHLHRNSLYYRLDKISDLVGLDPRVANEALELQLALLVLQEPAPSLDSVSMGEWEYLEQAKLS